MPDIMTQEQRSERMSRVRSKDSKAELVVRSLVHRLGFRYGLHNKKLPGKPDIVLTRHKKVILIHGCFWHQHGVCRPLAIPKKNGRFWRAKFADNVDRDKKNIQGLTKLGWKILVVWECETKDIKILEKRIRRFLSSSLRQRS